LRGDPDLHWFFNSSGDAFLTHDDATRRYPTGPGTVATTPRFNRFNRFHRFHNRTFVFIDTFGFPLFYPYYGYYPYGYGYYGYNAYGYGNGSSVVELQRRLARAGYYHGRIDGVMGTKTRRALRAYQRDHRGNMRAY
jgi:Putative peptidoglycan binding domain